LRELRWRMHDVASSELKKRERKMPEDVHLNISGAGESDEDHRITEKARAFERRLSESDNYLCAFIMDPIQTLAREGLLEGATEFSMKVKEGSLAKLAWGQDLYRRDPIGVLNMSRAGAAASGGGGGGGVTVKVDVQVCITLLGRRFCWGVGKHL